MSSKLLTISPHFPVLNTATTLSSSTPSKPELSFPPHHRNFHSLSERTHIPSHVYKHPTAILLELCTSMKELHQILPLIIKNGLYSELLFQTKLVSLFCKYGSPSESARVFHSIEDKLDVFYHTLLKGYAKNSSLEDAFSFFVRMRYDDVRPVVYNFTYLMKALGDNSDLKRGKEIHGQLIKHGFGSNLFAMTSVVNMYAKCREIGEAYKMFDRMPERDLVSWNTIIAGYAQNGYAMMALDLVLRMQNELQKPDSITLVTVLPAVADMMSLKIGKSVHGYVVRAGFDSLVNISTALVDMYSKCRSLGTARLIFDRMDNKTVVSWNSMIDGYVQSEQPKEAMAIFRNMLDKGFEPTNVTIMEALHACADLGDLEQGKFVHKLLDKLKLGYDVSVMNSLISMYSKCKKVDIAAKLFENLRDKTRVTWNAMILGYAQNGCINEALSCFSEMQSQNIKLDSFTMVSVITALAELSVTRQAKWIHGLVIRTCLDKNVFVMTALVDMYAKCGAIHTARQLFDMMDERHVTTWNAMIDGYGTHGLGKASVDLFNEMQKGTIKPNDITFLCVISACSHSGLVKEGLQYFESMKKDYGLDPAMDHYGAMVDLLGRAGKLNDAWDFIQKMPTEPGISVFGAMLGACRIHKNVELGEKAAKKIFELNPEEGGYHVLLSNIYATASMWDKMAKVRTVMEKKGLQKTPGCSLVDLRNEVHSFYSGSTSHPQSKQIYAFLQTLGDKIKAAGYVPDTNSIHDVEDDVKEQLLNSHSEKLAIAFGLLNTRPGTTIHIRKNLRVCGDCHNATKYISLVTGREIIVRDMHRFHHFKNGTCSCGDYW
ncbi:pentatricopeptide repeat-containing protein At1g11290, chloroplastic [Ziziphus jujuba]|uniref:Pentatricopeptide repeat-containing protein At1g11290, chloroplastic n=1 Tax=Ziziphus jujuba TaxID=326968 RepID=A0A6P3ZDH3_ZIZJJ|nr:pentatricopeptide repeat-containing protein At1g11290, chloroplastic [Ziziphus jujuba]